MPRKDLLIAPAGEALLILVVAIVGWAAHQPLIFASLGPTAYELVETPARPSARSYNIIVGHLIGVLAGFLALYLAQAWQVPPIGEGGIALPRVWAAAIAATLTVLVTLVARAAQPAAVATTLLIALGNMPQWRDGFFIMGGVLLMTALGTPIRNLRLKAQG